MHGICAAAAKETNLVAYGITCVYMVSDETKKQGISIYMYAADGWYIYVYEGKKILLCITCVTVGPV
jgi:hypothetical protein